MYFGMVILITAKRYTVSCLNLKKQHLIRVIPLHLRLNWFMQIMEACKLKGGICIHPSMARIPEHAVGINMKKTAKKAEMELKFPISGHPEPMTILLID